ncbi:MAG: NADP(H)-dependent aldo-keto reductase [Flavobacterium sp.]|nr:NADP(H)-dependent aldo-keto reductase [Flavobacterium sp.]
MQYTTLPGTDINISKICLGTMTFGQQNTEADGHAQIDFALEKGINFIDTAEMYPVPAREKTYGRTEEIIGSWIKKTGKRKEIVLASKVAGANRGLEYIREDLRYNAAAIHLSVEKSLKRLQTDYIDLYQLHWPERKSNMFGQLGFKIQEDRWEDNTKEILETLQNIVQQGKIRQFGVSNETPWGLLRFLEESKKHNLPKAVTIQNPYSLLNRTFEIGLTETIYRENVGLLAYSPLAFGLLSGKFRNGAKPADARLTLFPNFTRYNSEEANKATELYHEIAVSNGLTLVELSLGFILAQPYLASMIIGATTLAQLEENIKTTAISLSDEVIKAIDGVHKMFPNPAP